MTKEWMKEVYTQLYAIGYVYWLTKSNKKLHIHIIVGTHGWITFEQKIKIEKQAIQMYPNILQLKRHEKMSNK